MPQAEKLRWRVEPSVEVCGVQCGGKCCRMIGYLKVTNEERRRMARLDWRIGAKFIKMVERPGWYAMNLPCPLQDKQTNLCTAHDARPQCCRNFPSKPVDGCLVYPPEEGHAAARLEFATDVG